MAELRVELHGEAIGYLRGENDKFDFVAAAEAIREHGLGSQILSLAIPLVPRANARTVSRRRNYFAELLAEGDARERLAQEAKLKKTDTMGMLRAYGRDVAGALQIWDPADPDEPRTPAIEYLDDAGVEAMLSDVANTPLGNKPRRGKSSLNGVQNKIVLVRENDRWARALDGYPSTHILKPIVPKYPTMIFDEEYGSRFARGLNLAGFDTHLERFNNVFALVVERYDRSPESTDGRIHQEDFSQVLGLSGDDKYEIYGQKKLGDVAKNLNGDDMRRLLQMVTLSVALGNLDMHAKNISLVHLPDGSVQLAPMYDVVPQAHQENDGEMAFSVGGEFVHRVISVKHVVHEGTSWGMREAATIVSDTLAVIARIAEEEKPHVAAHPGLLADVKRFANNLAEGRAVGDNGDGSFVAESVESQGAAGGWGWPVPQLPSV